MKKDIVEHGCPLNSFKPCREKKCAWYTHVRGKNPNTGEEVDHWGCAIAWLPVLLIENSQKQHQTGAAIESFRNEMVRINEKATAAPFIPLSAILAPLIGRAASPPPMLPQEEIRNADDYHSG